VDAVQPPRPDRPVGAAARPRRRKAWPISALLLVSALCGACGSGDGAAKHAVGAGEVDPRARALLPAAVLQRGTLSVAMDPTYAPDEFAQPDGTLGGMDVDLVRALGVKLGLAVELDSVPFHAILAGVQQGKYDMGVSSITDTTRREELGDFVTYFEAGSSLIVPAGNPLGLFPDDDTLCGRRVAAQQGTIEVDPVLSSRSAHCVADGLPAIHTVVVAAEADARQAMLSGAADAMVEDSPVAVYEAARSTGRVQISGDPIDKAPYGLALPKEDKAMDDAVLTAVQDLIADGEYARILAKWGLTSGTVPAATLDGAID
jgi:polar amino acid transport system substrate-binding protein